MVLARQYWVTFLWVILLLCMLLGMLMFRQASAEVPWPDETLEPLPAVLDSKLSQEPMMMVSRGGVLHAVHPVTMKTLWTFASGADMGSVIRPRQGKEGREINSSLDVPGDDDIGGEFDEQVIYKGPDGELYILEGSQIGSTPMNIKTLLANSPHHTDDGAVVLSTVKNTAFLLNKDTGALIRKFDSSGSVLEKAASIANGQGKAMDAELLLEQTAGINADAEKKVSTLLCLRTDYSVTVQELATGKVRWNVSLADVQTVPLVQSPAQTPMLGPSEIKGEGKIVTPVVGASMASSMRSCQLAPIAVFSQTGEYVSNLLPVSSSFQDPGRKSNPLSEMNNFGKPSSIYRVQPLRDNAEKNGLLRALEGAARRDLYPKGGFPGQNSFDTVPSLDNRSTEHRRVTTRPGYDIAWGSIGGFLLLVTGLLSSGWYLYNRYTSRRREGKPKKVGTNKRGKKSKKGSSSTHIKRLSEEDAGNEVKPLPNIETNGELAAMRGIVMNKSAYGDGIQVGRLFVTKVLIGAGSNGTSVFEGYLDGRHVAVKRLLAHHYDRAVKEIKFLITSDEHPNVVRYFAMEETSDFVYVALERCALSFNDLIVSESERSLSRSAGRGEVPSVSKYLKMPDGKNLKLWNDAPGLPRCSSQLLQLMRDTVAGLAHLHAVGIVHRDLKPHNVLVSNNRILQAKLADMGLSKHLENDVSSYQDTGKGGSGSRGWQAPEQLKEGRQTRAVDVFSLGCLFFFCITGGHHPYGEHWLRDANIANGTPDFFLIEEIPVAYHLIKAMLSNDPSKRPAAKDVLLHPFFWNGEQRLSFLLKASDRVEHEDRVPDSVVLPALEAIGPDVFGASWETKLDSRLLDDGRRYRKYNFSSVRDLLRIIRNKSHHFMELSPDMQESLGPFPEGFEIYFSAKFPRLLMEVYKVLHDHCKEEPTFKKFFESSDVL